MSGKICYITTIPGTMDFFIEQLNYLDENGFDVTIICSSGKQVQNDLNSSIHVVPVEIPRGISFVGSIRAVHDLLKVFKEQKFDIIQYSTPNAAFCASIAAKLAGCRIRNYHLMGLRYLGSAGFGRTILKSLEKVTCGCSTHIECVSNSNMEMGVREGLFPREKVTVIWNGSSGGVDFDKFDYGKREQWRREVRKELGYMDSDFVYGFVGRITGDKGVNELLQAFLSLHTTEKLFLIGWQENTDTLNPQWIDKARNNANIQFHIPVTDVERYFAAIDVLLLPSYREGFGNVVIEAAAMGTPAIVTDIPGPTDAIERGKTALVIPSKDVDSLTQAMKQIRSMDYRAMGRAAAEFAKTRFDSKVLCEKILQRKKYLLECSEHDV